MTLILRIKDSTLGKGWYKVTLPNAVNPKMRTDLELIRHIKMAYPDAEAIQITREYENPV